MNFIKNFFFGIVIGIANIVPGLSGGTMAVVFNVYDRLINSISSFTKDIKNNILFLINIGLGLFFGILLFSNTINYLIQNYYMITNIFFIGLILGSCPMIYSKVKAHKIKMGYILTFILFLGLMILTSIVPLSGSEESLIRDLSLYNIILLVISSVFASACMIIPGISGSFIFLLFGVYSSIVAAISEFNFSVLFTVGIGCIIGFLGGAKAISVLLKKVPDYTYYAILGLVFGSIPVIFLQIVDKTDSFVYGDIIFSIIFLFVGTFASYIFGSDKIKKYFKKS